MTRRAWLRHPATTPPPRPECPTRRYPSQGAALDALQREPYNSPLTPTPCTHGHTGWHLTQPEPEPADCEPAWQDTAVSDRIPSQFEARQHEMRDLRDQGPGPAALRTATTINAPEYL